jgi:ribosomal protein S21
MGVWVDVKNNDLTRALRILDRRTKESGLTEELAKRQYHVPKSKKRFLLQKQAYNNEMARRISSKLYWLRKRHYVE